MDDVYFAACQGLGLALATGAFGGASGRRGGIGTALLVFAMVGGGALFGWSLDQEGHPAWPGFIAGAGFAAFSFVVVRGVAEGASERADGSGFVGGLIALAALGFAGLSLVVEPISLPVLAGLIWLYASRRRKAAEKYEGLRSLR